MDKLEAAALIIAKFEGWSPKIYKDAVGLPTIGYGHLIKPGDSYTDKTRLTKEEGLALLQEDIKKEGDVLYGNGTYLTTPESAAIISLAFNIGKGAFNFSTLSSLLNKYCGLVALKEKTSRTTGLEDMRFSVAEQFAHWRRGDGKILPGLQKRRLAEAIIFLGRPLDSKDARPPSAQWNAPIPMSITDANWGMLGSAFLRKEACGLASELNSQLNL